jgi:hypothetical protein
VTTIIYEHKSKTITCDSRAVIDGGIIGSDDCIKWRYKKDKLFFFAGLVCEFDDFMAQFGVKCKPDLNFQTSAIMVDNMKAYLCGVDQDDGWWQEELAFSASIGSGRQFALSALDFGKNSREAIDFAATRDIYTGGKCHVFDMGKASFI